MTLDFNFNISRLSKTNLAIITFTILSLKWQFIIAKESNLALLKIITLRGMLLLIKQSIPKVTFKYVQIFINVYTPIIYSNLYLCLIRTTWSLII